MIIENGVLKYVVNKDIVNGQFIIPDSVTSIGHCAFELVRDMTSVVIPDSVISIEKNAFMNCTNLTSVVIPDSVTSIGDAAFYQCRKLVSVIIPKSITSIGDCMFTNCNNLASIVLPESITSIGSSAFYYCNSLASIVIPGSITSVGKHAFYDCDALSLIYIEANNKESYERVYALLPEEMQKKTQDNHTVFTEKAMMILTASNHPVGFFKENAIPADIIRYQLSMLAKEYAISPYMLNLTSQKLGIDTESSNIGNKPGFGI